MRWNGISGLRPAAVGLGALVLLVGAYLLVTAGDQQGSGSPDDSTPESSAPSSTEAAESTASESDTAEATSPSATGSPEPPLPTSTTPPASETLVHVAIAEYNEAAQAIEISAGAPGIATDAGVCVVSATNGAATVSVQQEAEFDGHGASCGLMALSVAGQPAGEWQVSVSFTSPKGDAVSESLTVVTT